MALWIAAGASPKEIAARAGHTSVVTVVDRYGHLLPGSETKVNDALDDMARDALSDPVPTAVEIPTGEISRHIRAIKPAKRKNAAPEKAAIPRGTTWAMRDLNSRPLPCEGSALAS